jgi:hypothetical protein
MGCGIKLEFCGVQTPNDKPYIESFIGCYKREEVYRNQYKDFFEAMGVASLADHDKTTRTA